MRTRRAVAAVGGVIIVALTGGAVLVVRNLDSGPSVPHFADETDTSGLVHTNRGNEISMLAAALRSSIATTTDDPMSSSRVAWIPPPCSSTPARAAGRSGSSGGQAP